MFDLTAGQMGRQWCAPTATDRRGRGILARYVVIGRL